MGRKPLQVVSAVLTFFSVAVAQTLVKDICVQPPSTDPSSNMLDLALATKLTKIWRTDGTLAGTTLVRNIPGILLATMLVASDRLFVLSGTQLLVSDGSAGGTAQVQTLVADPLGAFQNLLAFTNDLLLVVGS